MTKTDSVLLSLELAYVLVTKTINKSLQAVRTKKKIKNDEEIVHCVGQGDSLSMGWSDKAPMEAIFRLRIEQEGASRRGRGATQREPL